MKIKSKYIAPSIHILVWLALLIIPAIVFRDVKFDIGLPSNFFLVTNLYHIALFYFNAYWLYPRFFTAKRWPLYIIFIVLLVVGSYHGKLLLLRLSDPSFVITEINTRIIFFPTIPFLIAGFIFRFIINRIRFERAEKERRAERLASELKFLRSQVSPHFLFNVLTNMVSLARKKSELLEPALIQLSDLLRYMLYETGDNQFPVVKEIEYLKNYIELQQLRFGEDVTVNLKVENEEPECIVEPMLLIPFVENAFKHGIGMIQKPFIDIALTVRNQGLNFTVSNNYNKENLSKDKNSGIGIANVKNRLELLYKNQYELEINDTGEIYMVKLNLRLKC